MVEQARALVAAEVQHALPYTLVGLRALTEGRRDEARALTEKARALPGRDEGVAVMVSMLEWPTLQRRLEQQPEDDATALEFEKMLAEFDALLGDSDDPIVGMLRSLRTAGWPMADQREITRYLAAQYGGGRTAPSGPQTYTLALAGVLAGMVEQEDGIAAARRFLSLELSEALRRRPMLMRRRSEGATALALWAVISDADEQTVAACRALAATTREASVGLGDEVYAGYLAAVEDWAAADDEPAQQAAFERLAGLTPSPIEVGCWLPASAPFVIGAALTGSFDRPAFLRWRMLSGAGGDPGALVPLAAAGLATDPAAAREMAGHLRQQLRDPRALDLLRVAEVQGLTIQGAGEGVAAQGAAREVLASDSWTERTARQLEHGVWMVFGINWGVHYRSRGPEVQVQLSCDMVALPKLPVARRLEAIARKR